MATPKVFIDGSSGTTGLRIQDVLTSRKDINLSVLAYDERRDPTKRQDAIAEADLAILCLPDGAAVEASEWANAGQTKVIDTSTAHRVAENWVYGLPEMNPAQRKKIIESSRVSNPGCYPTGLILSIRPVIEQGLLLSDAAITIHALSGYSGGGKT